MCETTGWRDGIFLRETGFLTNTIYLYSYVENRFIIFEKHKATQRHLQIDSSQANSICGAKIKVTGNLEIFLDSFLYTCLDEKWYRDLKDLGRFLCCTQGP